MTSIGTLACVRTPRVRFFLGLGFYLAAASTAALVPFLTLSGYPALIGPILACGGAMALNAWVVRPRHGPAVAAALAAVLLCVVAGDTSQKTVLVAGGRETTAVVMDIAEAELDGYRWYRLTEVGSLDDLGRWAGPEDRLGPGETLWVVADPAGRVGPMPSADVDFIAFEWTATVIGLSLLGLFCWLAVRPRRKGLAIDARVF
ncbi:hypothetical protein GCM10010109_56300 [Actinoplanes campanulatus]|nr:hypothetical protein GCM10010109_56300 [Actinoplanes campanulatus]GID38405.1 hypothetical protein Aca09nite_49110 [Actinoplanes campanulatus]